MEIVTLYTVGYVSSAFPHVDTGSKIIASPFEVGWKHVCFLWHLPCRVDYDVVMVSVTVVKEAQPVG